MKKIMKKKTRKVKEELYPKVTSGEPIVVSLDSLEKEKMKVGEFWVECCDCGLRHLLAFEIKDNELIIRAFRVPK